MINYGLLLGVFFSSNLVNYFRFKQVSELENRVKALEDELKKDRK